jgi:glycopeptide antibiotics resistance protein
LEQPTEPGGFLMTDRRPFPWVSVFIAILGSLAIAVAGFTGCSKDKGGPGPLPQPKCELSTTALDLGSVTVGECGSTTSFTIKNAGDGTLVGSVAESCADFAIMDGSGAFSLGKDAILTVTIRFCPTSAGNKTCAIATGISECASVTCVGVAVPVPTAACCQPEGSCTVTTAANCQAPSVWHANWMTCQPNDCPVPPPAAACCNPTSGACTLTVQAVCQTPNVWHADWPSCDPTNPCPPPAGACCSTATGACTVTTQAACAFTWLGAGTNCTPNPCLATEAAITAFSFQGLFPAVTGTINEIAHTIALTVPFGTNVTDLVATFTTTGASVAVGGVPQVSGTTANNFTSPVSYTVTAADASTQAYVVTVTAALSPAKAITAFSFQGLSPAVTGTINEAAHTIALTVPFGTNVTALVATFTTTGASVAVGATPQVSGTTANNFTSPVTYTVTAADASTQACVVTVITALSPAKAITAFSFQGLSPAVAGTINEAAHTIALTVPFGTNVTALVTTFTTTGASVAVGATPQASGTTANNFTSPVTYTVTAADASTQDYLVTVAAALSPAKAITAFGFQGLSPAVAGTINEIAHTVTLTVPFGTNVTALVATFTTTGASVKVGVMAQVSGTTANDFTSPVTYTVTAADASAKDYLVTVAATLSPTKAITAFSFQGLPPAVTGTINETAHTIALTVPFGTNVTALVATFTTTGASVKVDAMAQVSGTTANNFTSPVTYTVTAADASTQAYIVTVTVALNSAKAITAFSFQGLSPAVIGTINETAHTIALTVPFGTNVTALVATFTTTGTAVRIGATPQVSGTTANNFTSPVSYTVTAGDASTQAYLVTVTAALNSAKAITAFSFQGLSPAVPGTITEATHMIALTVPYGTNVTALVATFSTTGASVAVAGTPQVSGTTANNFANPVTYTVTAADASTQAYLVTMTTALNSAKAITTFSFQGLSPAVIGIINETAHTIALTVPFGTDVTALVATFTTTGTAVTIGATPQASGTTANNFTSPVSYTVTAGDGSTQSYLVTVEVAPSPPPTGACCNAATSECLARTQRACEQYAYDWLGAGSVCSAQACPVPPPPIGTGPNVGGVLWVHSTGINYFNGIPFPPQSNKPVNCAGVDNLQVGGVEKIWKVYAAFPAGSSPRLKGLGWGIQFPAFTQYGVAFVELRQSPPDACGLPNESGPGTDYSIEDFGFPHNSGGEVRQSFPSARLTTVVELYYFTGYAFHAAVFPVWSTVPHSDPAYRFFLDDAVPQHKDPIIDYGSLGFGTPGYTPCPGEPPTGACCNTATGVCNMTTGNACQDNWRGAGVLCNAQTCPPPPTGACCNPSTDACSVTTQTQCPGGSTWHGNWASCSPDPCPHPVGACCNFDDQYCWETTETGCGAGSEVWQGAGTACAPGTCQW